MLLWLLSPLSAGTGTQFCLLTTGHFAKEADEMCRHYQHILITFSKSKVRLSGKIVVTATMSCIVLFVLKFIAM